MILNKTYGIKDLWKYYNETYTAGNSQNRKVDFNLTLPDSFKIEYTGKLTSYNYVQILIGNIPDYNNILISLSNNIKYYIANNSSSYTEYKISSFAIINLNTEYDITIVYNDGDYSILVDGNEVLNVTYTDIKPSKYLGYSIRNGQLKNIKIYQL